MSWRDAPVYVRAGDLARWLHERAAAWSGAPGRLLVGPVAGEAQALVEALALALTFPAERAAWLATADGSIVRLRERLRLAAALGVLSAGGLRYAAAELAAIGRMVGGWRRRGAASARRAGPGGDDTASGSGEADLSEGDGPSPAPTGQPHLVPAAGAGTTTRTGRGRRTATGTIRGTPGTTTGSASCSPPPPPARGRA